MATALQLVNKALRELREPQVTDFSADYTLLALQKVNQARREIENVRPWDALRVAITFPTVSGTETYNLGTGTTATGGVTNERSYLVKDECGREMIFDVTSKTQLSLVGTEYHRSLSQLAQMTNAQPGPVSLIRASTGYTMRMYPKPNGVYSIVSTWIVPQPDFTLVTDNLSIPEAPVYLLAASYLAAERGDGMGEAAANLRAAAMQAVNDAIQFGSDLNELTFYVE